jgi:proteasome lid subunit RPN8/RPN11
MELFSQENLEIPFDLIKSNGAHVFIAVSAVNEMLRHAHDGFPLEIGGHLLGTKLIVEQSDAPITYIDRALQADAISTHTHVTFLPTNAVKVHETCEQLGMQVVGYYHSHPGFGVFQSGEDVQNFTLYYPYDYQLAVVVDPTKVDSTTSISSKWLGFFGWTSSRKPYLLEDSNIVVLEQQLDLESDWVRRLDAAQGESTASEEAGEEISTAEYEQSPILPEGSVTEGESGVYTEWRKRIARRLRPQ